VSSGQFYTLTLVGYMTFSVSWPWPLCHFELCLHLRPSNSWIPDSPACLPLPGISQLSEKCHTLQQPLCCDPVTQISLLGPTLSREQHGFTINDLPGLSSTCLVANARCGRRQWFCCKFDPLFGGHLGASCC
jgi:hypothetical protein